MAYINGCFSPQMYPTQGSWGNDFGNCCNRMMGPRRGGLWGALAGGLIGTILGAGNPFMGLAGAGIGALIGHNMSQHNRPNCGSHHHPQHHGCASYPPAHGHHFGGPQFGGYHQPQHCHQNFNRCCPPSRCCPGQGRGMGQLNQEKQGKPITYTTSGGYNVTVDKHTITIKDPSGKNTVQHWGDPHEKLNGKHIKDWQQKQRTVVLGDGTKITMNADGPKGVTLGTSIYDGNQNVQINNKTNTIEHHSFNPYDTMYREMSQYDGETSVFYTNRNGAGIYNNIYSEDSSFNVTSLYQQLGRTGGYHNPGKVYDFFDDPTLSKT